MAPSPSPSLADRSALVARLRAAGCVFAEDEADLLLSAAGPAGTLAALTARRIAGEPLEQVLGWAEFYGLRIPVSPGVFVPRQRTALLVDAAVALAVDRPGLVELCCGSGAMTMAFASRVVPGWVLAVDIEPAAVRCARRNLAGLGAEVYEGDLFEPLPVTRRGRVDVLLANAPYVPSEAVACLPPEARLYEPLTALAGGADGLDVLRRIAEQASDWLAPGGHLVVEASSAQLDVLCGVLKRNGLVPGVVSDPDGGKTAAVTGRRP